MFVAVSKYAVNESRAHQKQDRISQNDVMALPLPVILRPCERLLSKNK